jgi:hypothetical protein
MFFLGYPVTEPLAPVGAEVLFVFPASDAGAPVGLSSWNSETRGWIGFGVFDCNLQGSVPGVKVTLDPPDPSVSEYYLQGSSAPDFDAMATSAGLSAGGFINVAPGMVTLTATPLGTNVPSSVVHVLVRPGYLSQVFLFPTP